VCYGLEVYVLVSSSVVSRIYHSFGWALRIINEASSNAGFFVGSCCSSVMSVFASATFLSFESLDQQAICVFASLSPTSVVVRIFCRVHHQVFCDFCCPLPHPGIRSNATAAAKGSQSPKQLVRFFERTLQRQRKLTEYQYSKQHCHCDEATAKAPTFFIDIAIECGLLCHPGKLTPPSQVVTYCGIMLDSRCIPIARTPLKKRERAIATTEYLLLGKATTECWRLSWSVVARLLES
jgi:hypothetical protein